MAKRTLFLFVLFLSGCFSEGSSNPEDAAVGIDRTVFAVRYAMAFRDFIGAAQSDGLLPSELNIAIPLFESEWEVGAITEAGPVTTATAGIVSVVTTECNEEECARRIRRTWPRGDERISSEITILYARGGEAGESRVIALDGHTRYHNEMQGTLSVTGPTDQGEWLAKEVITYGRHDRRLALEKSATFAEMTSTATPLGAGMRFETKNSLMHAVLKRSDGVEDFRYSAQITYEGLNIRAGDISVERVGNRYQSSRSLAYEGGRELSLERRSGTPYTWRLEGETLSGGVFSGESRASGFVKKTEFPKGLRFSSVEEKGTYSQSKLRNDFNRMIVGRNPRGGTLNLGLKGTYHEKTPGVWEVSAQSNESDNLRIGFTYQETIDGGMIAGSWSTLNGDVAGFEVRVQPDWTSLVTYTFDDASTSYAPDEFGTIRFRPDDRGIAQVSVVTGIDRTESGAATKHYDLELGIVAEGERL